MADLNLIPNEYREWLLQRSLLKRFVAVIVVVNLILVASSYALNEAGVRTASVAGELRRQSEISQRQQMELQVLRDQKAKYERQWSLLQGLRAGAAVEDIFLIVDRAIAGGDLWLLDWGFRRAGVVTIDEQNTVETGRFIIVTEDNAPDSQSQLQVETHMSIRGQARDHQALSTFVRGLFAESLVKDVSVRKTSQFPIAGGNVVNFDITVVLNSPLKDS